MMHDNDGTVKAPKKPTKDAPQMYGQGKNLVIMAFSLYSTLFLQTNMFTNICLFIAQAQIGKNLELLSMHYFCYSTQKKTTNNPLHTLFLKSDGTEQKTPKLLQATTKDRDKGNTAA